MNDQDPIQKALQLPGGARFYRCALQVNPFEYLRIHHKETPCQDEDSYNQALVQKCQELGIEVIGVTDHYRTRYSTGLIEAAGKAGLHVFPGFEAVSKDGVHLLCLFEPGRPLAEVDRYIGACGIHDTAAASPAGDLDTLEILEKAPGWGCACIAAHVASDGGLLRMLKNQARVNAWRSLHLLACSLPGAVAEAPDDLRSILQNKNPDYGRTRPVAVINAQDVNGPEDLAKPGASCWIKMSEVSVEGLRQAFLDPDSRIRLASDPEPVDHFALVAMTWEGGFLSGQAIHFNPNLNALIGGRGAGKSTLLESIRYVLDLEPLGADARKGHEGIVRDVLRSGTRISLLVRSTHPSKREYRIERIVPNPPVVKDLDGQVLPFHPREILPGIEAYGQHEISELTKSPEKLTRLLGRFVARDHDPSLKARKSELERELARSRSQLLSVRGEIQRINERLSQLPGMEETVKRYQEAGLEDRLKDQSLIVREEGILRTVDERFAPFRELLEQLRRELPIDRAFLAPQALLDLPGRGILEEAEPVLAALDSNLQETVRQMELTLRRGAEEIGRIRERWELRRRSVQAEYEKILRELQRANVDGEEFIRLRRKIEELRPLRERTAVLKRELDEIIRRRRSLLAEWEEAKSLEFRELEKAAKRVNKQLARHVRAQVTASGDHAPLLSLLQECVQGRLAETKDSIRAWKSFSLRELADQLRQGADAVQSFLGIPPSQAERLVAACPDLALRIEELDLPATTTIELNVGSEEDPSWQALEDLSTGQKATAVLLLLLLDSDAPLIIDQPEDDLDNRFITEVVVQKMKEEKRRRQFVVSTHNANIPVLGDAELIAGLRASQGQAEIPPEHLGSIDSRQVRDLVEEILEGGERAFELRRLKYGF